MGSLIEWLVDGAIALDKRWQCWWHKRHVPMRMTTLHGASRAKLHEDYVRELEKSCQSLGKDLMCANELAEHRGNGIATQGRVIHELELKNKALVRVLKEAQEGNATLCKDRTKLREERDLLKNSVLYTTLQSQAAGFQRELAEKNSVIAELEQRMGNTCVQLQSRRVR